MHKILLIALVGFSTACGTHLTTPTATTPADSITPTQANSGSPTVMMVESPTPTFTPMQTPVPMYFTEGFESDLRAWVTFQTGGATLPIPEIENGHLRLDINSSNVWFYAIHDIHEYPDVHVSAKVAATPSGALGLICRYGENGWFEYNISSDGKYSVLFAQWLGEGIAQYSPIRTDESEYLQPGELAYEIGLTCQGNHLLLHVNGKLFRKLDVSRYALTSGRIGLSFASFEEVPMIAAVDWVKVNFPTQ